MCEGTSGRFLAGVGSQAAAQLVRIAWSASRTGAGAAAELGSRPVTSESNTTVPRTAFGGDDGSPDPNLAAALSAYESGEGGPADVLAALAGGRVLVPVVAMTDDVGDDTTVIVMDPARGERSSSTKTSQSTSMAAVSTVGRDGRRGLLAFTSLESMHRWDPDARPVPMPTRAAAEAALADGADALVIDLAGPVLFSVDAEGLRALASGWRSVGAWGG